jgi:hypothetical protein
MKQMKKLLLFTLILFNCFHAFSQEKLSGQDKKSILDVFKMTEDAWNIGDIDRFMEGYWKSDKLIFVGASGPTYGWEATRERYHTSYPDLTAMGKLAFEVLDMYKIDTKTVLLIGKFHLSRTIGDVSGHYTLVWQKIDGKWVIVCDHSSASED